MRYVPYGVCVSGIGYVPRYCMIFCLVIHRFLSEVGQGFWLEIGFGLYFCYDDEK